jgi:CDP-diglyceride synthetase
VNKADAFAALTFLMGLAITGWFYGVLLCVVFALASLSAYLVGYDHGREAMQ